MTDLFALTGKRVLITGGAQGLGHMIAQEFCGEARMLRLPRERRMSAGKPLKISVHLALAPGFPPTCRLPKAPLRSPIRSRRAANHCTY